MSNTNQSAGYDPDTIGGGGITLMMMRSGTFIASAKLIRYGFIFLVHLLLMNLLAPADFGAVRYVTVILGILNIINEFGLNIAIVQRQTLTDDEVGSVCTLNFVFNWLLYLVVCAAAPLIEILVHIPQLAPLIIAGALSIPLGGASIVHRAVLQRRFRFGHLSAIEVASAFIGSGLSLVFALRGMGRWSLVWGTVAYHASSTVIVFLSGSRIPRYFSSLRKAVPLFTFGISVIAQHITDYVAANTDYIIIGRVFGAAVLGIYGVAYSLVTLPQVALSVIVSRMALSVFSRSQHDNEKLGNAFLKITIFGSIVSAPFLAYCAAMAGDMMMAVTIFKPSDTWMPAAEPIRILSGVGLLYAFTSFPGHVWLSKGKLRLRMVWSTVMLISVIIAVAAGSRYGMIGVCWALLVRAIVLFPAASLVTRKVIGLAPSKYYLALIPAAVSGGILLALFSAVSPLFPL